MNTCSKVNLTLEELVEKANDSDISSIRNVLSKIIEVINDPNSSAWDLKNLIEKDPPLAARVLKRSNSAYYGMTRRMQEVFDAIICMGFEAVRELALSQKVCELFASSREKHGYSPAELWKHSVAVAMAAKMVFRREFRLRGEDIYAAGLLHDIGIIVEDQFIHDGFGEVVRQVNEQKVSILAAEREAFGFMHSQVGGQLAQTWNFPDTLTAVLDFCDRPEDADAQSARMAMTLFICDHACQQRKIGYVECPGGERKRVKECMRQLNLSECALNLIMDEVTEEVRKMAEDGWF